MTGDRAGARDVSARTKGQAGKLPIAPVTGTERRPRRSRDVLKVNPGSGTPPDRDCSLGQTERSREEDKKRNETGGKRTEEERRSGASLPRAEEDGTKNINDKSSQMNLLPPNCLCPPPHNFPPSARQQGICIFKGVLMPFQRED